MLGLRKALRWLKNKVVKKAQGLLLSVICAGPTPKHVAFIMDGNRRYARCRHRRIQEGHYEGFLVLRRVSALSYTHGSKHFSDINWLQMLEICYRLNIKCVSVFAFAIDNFSRPEDEVEALMSLAEKKLIEFSSHGWAFLPSFLEVIEFFRSNLLNEYGVRLNVVGNVALLPESVQRAVRKAERMTRHNNVFVLFYIPSGF